MRISDWSSDVCSSDLLEKVKNITRNDVIAAWRMNPALAGIIPENNGGFGDIEKIDRVYTSNEIRPICQLFNQLNDTLRDDRSAERRVGKECVSTCRTRWSPDH